MKKHKKKPLTTETKILFAGLIFEVVKWLAELLKKK